MRHLRSALGAIALVAGAIAPIGVAATPSRAASAPCGPDQVTVVVDYGSLGSPLTQGCAPAHGDAAAEFLAAGIELRYAQQVPGAVCQVDSQPADAPCQQMPPANAYWGLFWTDGTTSTWTYSSFGVQSLAVPAGGSVAFAWQTSTSPRYPAFTPSVTRPKATPPPRPSRTGTSRPGKARHSLLPSVAPSRPPTSGTSAHAQPPATASTSAPTESAPVLPTAPTSAATPAPATESSSPAPASPAATGTTSDAATQGGGLPPWIPVALIGVLVLAAGVIVAVRRRS